MAYPNSLTMAQRDALPQLTIADFRVGLTYRTSDKVASTLPADPKSTEPAPGVYVMRSITVKAATVNQDLVEFQDYVRRGRAYA